MKLPDTSKAITELTCKINKEWEKRMQLCIQPKPRWMPAFLWRRVLSRVFTQTTRETYGRPGGECVQPLEAMRCSCGSQSWAVYKGELGCDNCHRIRRIALRQVRHTEDFVLDPTPALHGWMALALR